VIDFADLDLPFNSEVVTVSTVNHMFGIFYDDVSIQYKLDNVLIFTCVKGHMSYFHHFTSIIIWQNLNGKNLLSSKWN